jgi:hypothetical protein
MAKLDRAEFNRRWRLHGEDPTDELHEEFWKGLVVRENGLMKKHRGKRYRANYMWRSLEKKGALGTMASNALKKRPSQGFLEMAELGELKLTDEGQILKYSDQFPIEVVRAAQEKLRRSGYET